MDNLNDDNFDPNDHTECMEVLDHMTTIIAKVIQNPKSLTMADMTDLGTFRTWLNGEIVSIKENSTDMTEHDACWLLKEDYNMEVVT